MGYESDFTIASSVGHEEDFVSAFGPSLDECSSLDILTKNDALRFLTPRVLFPLFYFTKIMFLIV